MVTNCMMVGFTYLFTLFNMIGGSILVMSRLQAVILRRVDFGGVTNKFKWTNILPIARITQSKSVLISVVWPEIL
ncbi:hypothetical protein HanPI659440_Chr09g0343751 [Helianthus annuus]|nr:hypothetical protein HanPI659440_Chr09g0343751 [Helianthus annuus]